MRELPLEALKSIISIAARVTVQSSHRCIWTFFPCVPPCQGSEGRAGETANRGLVRKGRRKFWTAEEEHLRCQRRRKQSGTKLARGLRAGAQVRFDARIFGKEMLLSRRVVNPPKITNHRETAAHVEKRQERWRKLEQEYGCKVETGLQKGSCQRRWWREPLRRWMLVRRLTMLRVSS